MEIRKTSLSCCQKLLQLVFCKVKLLYNSPALFSAQKSDYVVERREVLVWFSVPIRYPETLRLVLMLVQLRR